MKKIIFFVFLFNFLTSFAKTQTNSNDKYPYVEILVNKHEHARITTQCNKMSDTNKIFCSFNQVIVGHKDNASTKKQLKLLMSSNIEDNAAAKSMVKTIAELCKNFDSRKKELKNRKKSFYNSLEKFCKNPSKETLIEWYKNELIHENQTCTIIDHTFSQEFSYQPDSNQWIHNDSSTQGRCNLIQIAYFELDPKEYSWKYTAKTIATNKDTKYHKNIRCLSFEQNESYLSADLFHDSEEQMNCKYVELNSFK